VITLTQLSTMAEGGPVEVNEFMWGVCEEWVEEEDEEKNYFVHEFS